MAPMSPQSLVTPMSPCLGADTLASLCAAGDAAGEGKCRGPCAAVQPHGSQEGMAQLLGAAGWATYGSPGPPGLGSPQEQDEEEEDGVKRRGFGSGGW